MTKNEIALKAVEALKKEYPEALCSLQYKDPFELLVATRLAAQCTDARVNLVTPALFKKYPDVHSMAQASTEDVEELIRSCGFYRTKAVDLIEMSKSIIKDFSGQVPDSIDALTSLKGVGRKTANLIVGDIYGKPAVVVDTHCMRITRRLGLHNEKNPEKIERILRELLPKEESNDFCHRLVLHGRAVCKAPTPKCELCCMQEFCKKNI
ncbi:MAG: endonuclease III [Ruminococcaceae bacterium]|nr:endonuclease III [Oscillospiraceae bacterium]